MTLLTLLIKIFKVEKLIQEISKEGKKAYTLPLLDVPEKELEKLIPQKLLRKQKAKLPEVSEPELIRHFVRLSLMNHHVDKEFYPLGSCTMKYNPKINEEVANLKGFTDIHPLQSEEMVQGALQIMYELGNYLAEIGGMDAISLQPTAGAHGELAGMKIIKAYHTYNNKHKTTVLVPDSAHGTNPASVSFVGYQTVTVKSDKRGIIDLKDLKNKLNSQVAAIMITNPNTFGLFEKDIKIIVDLLHEEDAQVYLDGANLNALLGITRPGDWGVDVVHFNLHKTFSTPHGGGGPGSGPIGVKKHLEPFLPVPEVKFDGKKYYFNWDKPLSIGKVQTFYGNFLVMIKAYTYIRMLGSDGLKEVAKHAIVNANYLKKLLEGIIEIPYQSNCMHEFVGSGVNIKEKYGVKTLDIAKRLLDYGLHAPTIYFPLTVREALMIEPTETESKETLEKVAATMREIIKESKENPEILKNAPYKTPVRRLDEIKAAKELDVCIRA